MDKESLRAFLEKTQGITPLATDLAALTAELAALEARLAQWRRLDLRDVEPAFLGRGPEPTVRRKA